MSNARLLALILAIIISGTVILFTAPAMTQTKPTKQSKSKPAPEQSAAAPAPEQPGGWIAEVKKSRPICSSADDYVQMERSAIDIAKRPSHKAMQKAIEFVQRKCPIAKFEPGDHVNVERTETFSINKTNSITLACVAIKDGPCAWTDASQLVRIPEEALAKKSTPEAFEERPEQPQDAAAKAARQPARPPPATSTSNTLTAVSPWNPETLRLPDGKWLLTDETTLGEGTSGSLLRELHGSLMLSAQSDGKQRIPFYLMCKLENTDEKRHVRYSIRFQPPVPPVKDSSGALVYHYKISHVWLRYEGRVSVAREFGPVSVHDNYADSVEVSPDFVDWFLRPDPGKATQGFQIEYQQTHIKLRDGRVVPKHTCSNKWWLAEDEIGRARFPFWNKPCVDCTFLDDKTCYEEADKLGLIEKDGLPDYYKRRLKEGKLQPLEYECPPEFGKQNTRTHGLPGQGQIVCPVPGAVVVEAPKSGQWLKTDYNRPPAHPFSDRCANLGIPQGWIAEVKRSTPICDSADDYVELQRWMFEKLKRPGSAAERLLRRERETAEQKEAEQKEINKEFSELVKRKCPIEAFKPGDRAGVEQEEIFTIDASRGRRIKLACVVVKKDGPCAWTEASALERIPGRGD